jgi:hypothetical protein
MAKKIKKPKKITQKKIKSMARTAKRKALAQWSLDVRERDGNKCVICGQKEFLNAHHILNKFKFSKYMLEINCGIALCPAHHQFGKFAAETNAVFFADWLMRNRLDQWKWVLDAIQKELSCENPSKTSL